MIVGQGVYRGGAKVEVAGDFSAQSEACDADTFVWLGLKNPTGAELAEAAKSFGIHHLAIEDAQAVHERPKVDVFGDTLTVVLRPAGYDGATERVEFGQITMMCSPHHIVVVRHGDVVPLDSLRAEMEARPELLAEGPGAVLHAILDTVVEAYLPVLEGIDDDIDDVEEEVFSPKRSMPTQRIYELKREVLELRKATFPLAGMMETLTRTPHSVVSDVMRLYYVDTEDDVKRIVDQIRAESDLLDSALYANLAQVGIRQNEDMRKISAWVAIAAVPTMVAGIYGMNFRHMPELETRYGYYVVIGLMALICLVLYRTFKRSGWL